MGTMSALHLDAQEQEMRDWICEQYESDDIDETSDAWYELVEEWHNQREHYEEISWYESQSTSELYTRFMWDIEKIKEILSLVISVETEPMIYKMTHAHTVTLLESFLSNSFIALISNNGQYLSNIVTAYSNKKNPKNFTLKKMENLANPVKDLVTLSIAEILFHKEDSIKKTYRDIFCKELDYDFKALNKIFKTRHDIMHRNGLSVQGSNSTPTREEVICTIGVVKDFVQYFESRINESSTR
jgi:hypothetical protein